MEASVLVQEMTTLTFRCPPLTEQFPQVVANSRAVYLNCDAARGFL